MIHCVRISLCQVTYKFRAFLKLSVDSLSSCFSAPRFPPLTVLAQALILPFNLPFASMRRRPC